MIDYFILDKEKKRLRLYDAYREDGFCKCFENIEKIQMEKNSEKEKQTRVIIIETKDSELPISIEIDKDNNIIGYSNPQLTQVGDNFLKCNEQLSELNLPQLTQVGDGFLEQNEQLSELNLPQLTQVGDGFLQWNNQLSELNLPQLTQVGNCFLEQNNQLSELNLPQLTQVGHYFIPCNEQLSKLNLPQLTQVGDRFLKWNNQLSELNLPQLTQVGNCFLEQNNQLSELNLPRLTRVGDGFLKYNNQLSELNLPQLTQVGHNFLGSNNQLSELNLPQLTQVGDGFLENLSAEVKQLAKIEGEKGIEINLKTEKTSLQQKVKEPSLKINKNNIFYKIKSFFKNLFYKDRKIENDVQIETISNDNIAKNENSKSAFIENIKIIEDENTLLLKRYIRGEIKKEDLTEEQRKSLYTLYHKQINNFKKSNEIRKNKLLQYKNELDL